MIPPSEEVVAKLLGGHAEQLEIPLPRGDLRLGVIRAGLAPHGSVRFVPGYGPTPSIIVTFEAGEPQQPVVALPMIARSDAKGLERAILSVLEHVDEIVIGVDGRSDAATREVAQAYADEVYVFGSDDVGLSQEEWAEDRIHFANARNIGRERVKSSWTIVLDTDEVLTTEMELREFLRDQPDNVESCWVNVGLEGAVQQDRQRIVRSYLRYYRASHNQLHITRDIVGTDVRVFHDMTLRDPAEIQRREKQRDAGMAQLRDEADEGDLSALFHAAKHRIKDDPESEKLIEEFRRKTAVHGRYVEERMWLALCMAAIFHDKGNYRKAEQWAVRVLLDGPRVEALCILGDIAEDEEDLPRARAWYELACVMEPEANQFMVEKELQERFARRDSLRERLAALKKAAS